MEGYKKVKGVLEKKKEKSIINDYYSKEINKGKSYKASSFDIISFSALFFLVFTIFLYNYIDSLIISSFIGLFSTIGAFYIILKLRRKKDLTRKTSINEELKSARVQREISQLNKEEFVYYIKEILDKNYLSDFQYINDEGIDLVGNINGKLYAVKCIKSSPEDRIIRKRITEFNEYINYLEYDDGIIITNSFFQDGIKESSALMLFDFNDIKGMLKKNKDYPSDEDIKNYILYKHEDKKKEFKNTITFFNYKKILSLYFISFVIYIASLFVDYFLYYRIAAILIFVLASIMGGIKLTELVASRAKTSLHK